MSRKPATVSLPPVRVEPRLAQALVQMAEEQGRSLSDVIRSLLRDVVAAKSQQP